MNALFISNAAKPEIIQSASGYLAGIILTFLVLLYLIYSLFKPEKF